MQQKGLTVYLSDIKLTTKEFRDRDNIKLEIVVRADEIYIVRTGIETNFIRGCLKSRVCCKKALSVYAVNR